MLKKSLKIFFVCLVLSCLGFCKSYLLLYNGVKKNKNIRRFKDGYVDGSLTNLLRTDLNYIEKYIYDSAFLKNKSCGLDKANNASYALLAKVGQTYLALEEYK